MIDFSTDRAAGAAWRGGPCWMIAEGIARFVPPDVPEAEVPGPTIAVAAPITPIAPVPAEFTTRPGFAREGGAGGRWLARVEAPAGTSFYGLGEAAGPLLRNGRRVVCWNTDTFEYDDTLPSMYQSHPWVIGVRPDGSSFGVLADTTWRCEVRVEPHAVFFAGEGAVFGVFVIERATPAEVLAGLAELTGRMPLPPRWALGYHQSRWSYEPEARVRALAHEFRARRVPCDVIWLDIDYMHGFRCFTFDPEKFPDPAALNADLHGLGFRSVWMIDPGIKVDPEYPVYAAGKAGDHFIKDEAGNDYVGEVWPGPSVFPDFTRESTRRWWAGLYREFMARGIDGVWNDMNEPTVFDRPHKLFPEAVRHRADESLGGPGPHLRYRNIYGMLMTRASREGIAEARPERRPFVLTRSNFIGGQRYAATWTGDNKATWDHLRWSIPMVLNLGLSGQPFSGPDIGGFAGECDAAMFTRWMGIGALLPFARAHSIKDSHAREPWSYGPASERVCRFALERRSRLMPYLYTVFEEAARTGMPIARPVFFADPADAALREADDSFLLGADVLVRARVRPEGACRAPMPPGEWRAVEPLDPRTVRADAELPEVFVRAGSILPLGPIMQHDGEKPLDPLTLVVCPDDGGAASGWLYEDEGDGYGYLAGMFRRTRYEARREGGAIVVRVAESRGRLGPADRALEVFVMLEGGVFIHAAARDGGSLVVHLPQGGTGEP